MKFYALFPASGQWLKPSSQVLPDVADVKGKLQGPALAGDQFSKWERLAHAVRHPFTTKTFRRKNAPRRDFSARKSRLRV